MNSMKEIKCNLNGSIGSFYNMCLRYKISKTEDGDNQLDIRIRIEELNIPNSIKDNINLLKELYTVMLKINNNIVAKESVVLDFSTIKNLVIINYKSTLSNIDTLRFNLEAFLQSDNESTYIKNTSLSESILVLPIKVDKLFIDLNYNDEGDKVHCIATPNIEPDFLEYKDTLNPWIKLDINSFVVPKTGKNQYIQVRGKYKRRIFLF